MDPRAVLTQRDFNNYQTEHERCTIIRFDSMRHRQLSEKWQLRGSVGIERSGVMVGKSLKALASRHVLCQM